MENRYKIQSSDSYPTEKLCPLKGGRRCDGRSCVFAVAEVERDYEAAPDEDGKLLDWETVQTTWACAVVPDRAAHVDTHILEACREHVGAEAITAPNGMRMPPCPPDWQPHMAG